MLLKFSWKKLHSLLLLCAFLVSPTALLAQELRENQMVRDVYFKDIQKQTHHLKEYRGKWVFVNYWAGYCVICAKEIPTLIRFQKENPDNVVVLGVNYGAETDQVIKADMKRLRFNYPIIPGQPNILNNFGKVVGTPTTVIISPEGKMVKKVVGRQTLEELYSHIKPTNTHFWDIENN